MIYPTYGQSVESDETTLWGRQIDRATNGSVKSRSFYTGAKKTFKVVHEFLTNTQKLAIESFYTDNQNESFEFTWIASGVTYPTCMFDAQDPTFKALQGGYWRVETYLVEV